MMFEPGPTTWGATPFHFSTIFSCTSCGAFSSASPWMRIDSASALA